MADEMFRSTLMGGFDKDDVLNKVQILKEEAYAEKSRLVKTVKEKEAKIEELEKRLDLKEIQKEQALEELREEHRQEVAELKRCLEFKEEQKNKLERQIEEKYQKYIDRYDLIGSLILDAHEKAEKIIHDAEVKGEQILSDAEFEADRRLTKVQIEVDEKLAEGKRKYVAVQEEMNEIIELINQAQRRFMASYKEVHRIITTMPESMRELDELLESAEMEKTCSQDTYPDAMSAAEASEAVVLEKDEDLASSASAVLENVNEFGEEEMLDEADEDADCEEKIFRIVETEDLE